MKVALVHDWLTGMRGGERCLEVFCVLFPRADVFTLLHGQAAYRRPSRVGASSPRSIERLPAAATRYRQYLALMPAAVGRFGLRGYDLVLSSAMCGEGARPAPGARHVCYCSRPCATSGS